MFLRIRPEGSSNSPILWLQLEGGYNPLCSSATTGSWLQPPVLAPSNRPEVEVEWWNQCHTITMRYIVVQLYQPVPLTCIQSIQLPCNQFVHELNMYLQKYNRYAICSVAARICTCPICYETYVCMRPNYYGACVYLLKTRVSFFLKTYDPL